MCPPNPDSFQPLLNFTTHAPKNAKKSIAFNNLNAGEYRRVPPTHHPTRRSPSPWLHRGSADLTANALKKAKKWTEFNNFGTGEYRRVLLTQCVSQCAAHQSPGSTEEAANLHGCLKTQMVRKRNCQAGNRWMVPMNLPTTMTLPSTPTLPVAMSR